MNKLFFIALILVYSLTVQAQTITTIAGNGTEGYAGDGGLAVNALLRNPNQIAYDQSGNLFIAEDYNHVVRKIDANGYISTVAGTGVMGFSGDGGIATNAQMNRVAAVAVDNAGNIYLSDADNFRIRKVDALGNINTIAGNGDEGYSGDGGLAINAELGFVSGICLDPLGNVYLANQTYHNIRKIDGAGIITTVAGDGSGNPGYGGEGVVAATSMVNSPAAVFMDANGNLFFSEFGGFRIRKINTSGILTTVAGTGNFGSSGDGGPAINAQLLYPYGLVVDAAGVIYVCESAHNMIRKIDASGIISAFAGVGGFVPGYSGNNGPALLAQFANPSAITLDNNNNVVIGDYGNHAIRKVASASPTSVVSASNDVALRVFPNPCSDAFYLSIEDNQAAQQAVLVYDLFGKLVYESSMSNSLSVRTSEWSAGFYLVRVGSSVLRVAVD
ncbi:MAG: T9SS type A sorting domain-containing protein [Flavobacteriales bacterium]|jgi:sugar lactone lactonase YvrE|nr:T9SS type A sorting domain-containing protein [Flavobacteriales bacterium]